MKKPSKEEDPFEKPLAYSLHLGSQADELLQVLGEYYFPNVEAGAAGAANMARWLLLQALADIDQTLTRAVAVDNYRKTEGIELDHFRFLNLRIKMTSQRAKKWHRRMVRK
jgi:hypothetical protein